MLITSPSLVVAQSNNRKALRLNEKGHYSLSQKKYAQAEQFYLKSIQSAPHLSETYQALGELYCLLKNYHKAVDIFILASKSCTKCANHFAIPLATTLFQAQQYSQAWRVIQAWQMSDSISEQQQIAIQRLKANIQYGIKDENRPFRNLKIKNLGADINTKYDEYFPSISPDDSTLIFTRRVNGVDDDFFIAKKDSCGYWMQANNMGEILNSSKQEGAHFISADRRYLFFMRCDNRSPNGWERGGCDLYFSYTESDSWAQPLPFRATINTPHFEGMPSLSSDNKELYFVSNRDGGYGGLDIWVSKFENGLWQIPQNLGPEINTPYDETAPFIAADNQTLYFTSNGHAGLGGNDIFVTRKQTDEKWEQPENMGQPINSPYDDVSWITAADGRKAYFASDRPGGYGRMDIYEVDIPESMQPKPYTFLYGIIYDSLDKRRLTYAQLEWYDARTGEQVAHYQSNRGDASYMSALLIDKPYVLKVERTGYGEYLDTLVFDTAFIVSADTMNIAMLPAHYIPPLQDTLVFRYSFVPYQVHIPDSVQHNLQKIIEPYLTDSEHVRFFVEGHSDSLGRSDSNEMYAYLRANALYEILKNKFSVSPEKIQLRAWADAHPLVDNETEENRRINRRVELTIRKPKE